MNLLVSNHLILLRLRSFSAISPVWSYILFHESMALTVTENFPKLFVLKDFFMMMAFYDESRTIVENITGELKPVFKDAGSMLLSVWLSKRILSIIVLSLNSRILFFWKKNLNESFKAEMILFWWGFFCSIIIC